VSLGDFLLAPAFPIEEVTMGGPPLFKVEIRDLLGSTQAIIYPSTLFSDYSHLFDFSIIEKGEEHCSKEIEAHKECMRKLGFKI